MLNQISVDTVRQVARLADQAGDAQDRFLEGMRNIDLGDQPQGRGDRHPTALDTLDALAATGDSRQVDALRRSLSDLSPEERIELRAIMLIGRGDFAAGQWASAMIEAAAPPGTDSIDDLAEKIALHDYLMKGLYELKLL